MAVPLAERVSRILQQWFLVEPLLFSVWASHAWVAHARIATIRVAQGRIEYNPRFLAELTDRTLDQVMRVEALRIVLKHPYQRRKSDPKLAYFASNMTVQEFLQTNLPLPRARTVFATDEYDQQYYEFYYQLLQTALAQGTPSHGTEPASGPSSAGAATSAQSGEDTGQSAAGHGATLAESSDRPNNPLQTYRDAGQENTAEWDQNEYIQEDINDRIRAARDNQQWGSVPGRLQLQILATLAPKLDYRRILRRFRASVLSQQRFLTRMKPSRRYGFDSAGSRRRFVTHLLFAVDVSGSIGNNDLQLAFSVINRFFKYGIEAIDVVQFDTAIKTTPQRLKHGRRQVKVTGRGGTNFQAVLDYFDQQGQYDGLIIFTDGNAPMPRQPKQPRSRILWLFNHERSYAINRSNLGAIGLTAFLREDTQPD